MMFSRRVMAVGTTALALATLSSSANASTMTTSSIQRLVMKGQALKIATTSVIQQLNHASTASFESYDPGCVTFSGSCTFGNPNGTKSIALFGDSHAQQWLPAFVVAFPNVKIMMHWFPECPAATLPLWTPATHAYSPKCMAWRQKTIRQLNRDHNNVIVLFEQTGHSYTSPTALTTDAQWKQGLAITIARLRPSHSRIVVMGDNPFFVENPTTCLSKHLRSIWQCTVTLRSVSRAFKNHAAAEQQAATALGIPYVVTAPWFCTPNGKCPVVVGNNVTYTDASHVTVAYAKFLGPVVRGQFKKFLS